jgi:GNAT superfamily N-acetyltransferase
VITIRAVRAGEGPDLRELRLRSLADAPWAFASTVEEESRYPDSRWSELADGGDAIVVYVAVDNEQWIGMAAGRWFDRDRGVAQLWGMWIHPAWRDQGLGRRLVAGIRGWATGHGGRFVRLGVIGEEAACTSFYERMGFVRTGETRPLPRDPALTAVFLARPA